MKHAAPVVGEFKIPAHYLLVTTQDFPLVFLSEDFGEVGTQGLPVGYGMTLLADARNQDLAQRALREVRGRRCDACSEYVTETDGCALQNTESGGGNPEYLEPYHLACVLSMDHYGIVPASAIEWIGVE